MRNILAQIRHPKKNILLHEYNDPRVIRAISPIIIDEIANISLLGDKNEILNNVRKIEPKLEFLYKHVNIIEPHSIDTKLLNQIIDTGNRNLDIGHVLLKNDIVNGMVSGSTISTGDVLRSALKNVGLKDNIKTLSSYFIMESKENTDPGCWKNYPDLTKYKINWSSYG